MRQDNEKLRLGNTPTSFRNKNLKLTGLGNAWRGGLLPSAMYVIIGVRLL
jgi:hypothetical protein